MLLPNALDAKPKRKRIRVSGGTGAGKLARKALKLTKDGELRVTLPAGTRTVTATLAKGAVRAGRKLRKAKPPRRLQLRVAVRDGDGVRPTRAFKLRPRRH